MKRKTSPSRNYSWNHITRIIFLSFKILLWSAGASALAFMIYSSFQFTGSLDHMFPIIVIPILLGIMYEYKNISKNWSKIANTFSIASIVSVLFFNQTTEKFGQQFVDGWPYVLTVFFVITICLSDRSEITKKLQEKVLLIESIACLYWLIEVGGMFIFSLLPAFLIFIVLPILYVFNHIFRNRIPSDRTKMFLSIWSCFILFLFSFEYLVNTIFTSFNFHFELSHQTLLILIQFFLFGVSSIYMMNNFLLLSGFFSGKNWIFGKGYRALHVERYSDKQMSLKEGVFYLLFPLTTFGLNFYLQWVDKNLLILLVLFITPGIFPLFQRLKKARI